MKRFILLLALIVLAVLLVLTMVATVASFAWRQHGGWALPFFPGTARATRTIEADLNLTPGHTLTINNPVGTVTVTGGEESSMTASLTAYGRTRDEADEYLDGITVDVRQTASGVVIDVRIPDRTGVRARIDHANLVLEVPSDLDIVIDSKMGRVTVDDIAGDLSIVASMGDVRVNDFAGSLNIRASMGSVNVRNARISAQLTLDASMGSISFNGTLGQTNEVSASMGSITLRLPADTCVDLHARVSMGSFRSGFPIADQADDDRVWQGVMGRGTPDGVLRVVASMGSVSIRQR